MKFRHTIDVNDVIHLRAKGTWPNGTAPFWAVEIGNYLGVEYDSQELIEYALMDEVLRLREVLIVANRRVGDLIDRQREMGALIELIKGGI